MLCAIFLACHSIADEGTQNWSENSSAVALDGAASCGACHSRVYDEWSESWMARSFSNATFQAIYAYSTEFDRQNDASTAQACLRCHAPIGFLYQDVIGARA